MKLIKNGTFTTPCRAKLLKSVGTSDFAHELCEVTSEVPGGKMCQKMGQNCAHELCRVTSATSWALIGAALSPKSLGFQNDHKKKGFEPISNIENSKISKVIQSDGGVCCFSIPWPCKILSLGPARIYPLALQEFRFYRFGLPLEAARELGGSWGVHTALCSRIYTYPRPPKRPTELQSSKMAFLHKESTRLDRGFGHPDFWRNSRPPGAYIKSMVW